MDRIEKIKIKKVNASGSEPQQCRGAALGIRSRKGDLGVGSTALQCTFASAREDQSLPHFGLKSNPLLELKMKIRARSRALLTIMASCRLLSEALEFGPEGAFWRLPGKTWGIPRVSCDSLFSRGPEHSV